MAPARRSWMRTEDGVVLVVALLESALRVRPMDEDVAARRKRSSRRRTVASALDSRSRSPARAPRGPRAGRAGRRRTRPSRPGAPAPPRSVARDRSGGRRGSRSRPGRPAGRARRLRRFEARRPRSREQPAPCGLRLDVAELARHGRILDEPSVRRTSCWMLIAGVSGPGRSASMRSGPASDVVHRRGERRAGSCPRPGRSASSSARPAEGRGEARRGRRRGAGAGRRPPGRRRRAETTRTTTQRIAHRLSTRPAPPCASAVA